MSDQFDPRIDILPPAQREIWPQLAPASNLSLVLYAAGVSLEKALGAFSKMYRRDPGLALRAIGFFKDGDLPSLPKADQDLLRAVRDRVSDVPDVHLASGLLPAGRA